jgi:hypothetical protein
MCNWNYALASNLPSMAISTHCMTLLERQHSAGRDTPFLHEKTYSAACWQNIVSGLLPWANLNKRTVLHHIFKIKFDIFSHKRLYFPSSLFTMCHFLNRMFMRRPWRFLTLLREAQLHKMAIQQTSRTALIICFVVLLIFSNLKMEAIWSPKLRLT